MKKSILFALSLLLLAFPLLAKQNAPVQQNGKAPTAFHAEFVANLDDVQEKIMALATATPAEKFSWRPNKDVRSISEVYMHIAGGNYFLATFLGVPAPKMNGDIEKTITTKADVIAELRRSFEHLRSAAN